MTRGVRKLSVLCWRGFNTPACTVKVLELYLQRLCIWKMHETDALNTHQCHFCQAFVVFWSRLALLGHFSRFYCVNQSQSYIFHLRYCHITTILRCSSPFLSRSLMCHIIFIDKRNTDTARKDLSSVYPHVHT